MAAAPSYPVQFEPNLGQAGPGVRFVARAGDSVAAVRDDGISLRHASPGGPDWQFQFDWEGAGGDSEWETLDPRPGTTSYIIGNWSDKWITGIPHFGRIVRRNLYDGIDLVLYGSESNLEYDLAIRAGADPGKIRMRFRRAVALAIGPGGDLLATVPGGKLILKTPKLFEMSRDGFRREVSGGYRLLGGGRAAFVFGRRDRRRPLLIDPVLVSATLLGGSKDSSVIAADPRTAIVGTTASADFPGVEAAMHRGLDIFVYDPNAGSTSIIGGSGDDIATCAKIFAAPNGGLVIGGYTNSRDFPVSSTSTAANQVYATQAQYGGGDWDGFVLTLNTSGQPVFATYLGGSGDDRVRGIDAGNYIFGTIAAVGSTTSTDFPVANAWQPQPGGGVDGFVTLYNVFGVSTPAPAPVSLSTYLGGSGDDRVLAARGLASGGDLYIGGVTASSDWQTPGSWSGSRNGSWQRVASLAGG
jgi:hypothetical protein